MNYRKTLMVGASALALNAALTGAVMLVPERAYACTAISSTTTINDASDNCITWSGGDINVTSAGTITGSVTGIYNSGNPVGSLTNSGSIGGSAAGIFNDSGSSIEGITNSIGGTISGSDAIYNSGGTIGAITNTGNIGGSGTAGIYNTSGSIGIITNGGSISGAGSAAILNVATIGSIGNTGAISGGEFGIENGTGGGSAPSTITAITNSGSISGNNDGIVNYGGASIGTITNASISAGTIGTITGNTAGIDNVGTIGTITNSGDIFNTSPNCCSDAALVNSGTIGTITNNDTIQGSIIGIENTGTIGAIVNEADGVISGNNTGIYNNFGSIGTLSNSGVISGNTFGIYNSSGSIGTLSNSGVISGNTFGIYNSSGSIGTLSNSGVISGNLGIYNSSGSIGTLSNSGVISGNYAGIYNSSGSIGTLSNSGVISGNYAGIYNGGGTIQLVNNNGGTISGNAYAIDNQGGVIGGGVTAIDSSSGTIIGAIYNSGTISGNIIAGQDLSIAGNYYQPGTLTGGTITANNLVILNHANELLQDTIVVGSGSGTVTNNGALQLNTAQSITGNYIQNGAGQLVIGVASSISYGELIVSGAATLSNSMVDLTTIDGGSLSAGESFTIVEASTIGSDLANVHAFSPGFLATATTSTIGSDEFLNVSLSACSSQTISGDTAFSGAACGLTWQSGKLSITSSGYVAGSATAILNSGNTLGTLTNAGFIAGSQYGIENTGTIGAIVNEADGVISGNNTGIYNNFGSIGTLSNSGVISGNTFGIYNSSGSIGTLSNSGVISGNGAGINNSSGSIGTLSNSGVISGNLGIYNSSGSIGTLSNSGEISGNNTGIYNSSGSIGTLSNSGVISGNYAGIYNGGGTIQLVNNTGTISDKIPVDACSTCAAINNQNGGTIGTITNSGLISGPNAIYSNGTNGGSVSTILSAITNTGTIAGNINVNQDLTFTGGNASTIGTLTGYNGTIGTITASNLTFDSAAYQLLDDDVNVGSGSGTVTNSGTLMINKTHTITGNYTQDSSALLVVGVIDPTHYGDVVVTGNVTMTNDHVSITPVSGSLTGGESFTIVQDSTIGTADYSGITATANGFTTSVTSSIIGGYDDLIIDLSGGGGGGSLGPYASIGATAGGGVAPAIGAALDQIHTNGTPGFDNIFTALNNLGSISQAAEAAGVKQLGPNQLAPQMAASTSLMDMGANAIGQHQELLTTNGTNAPVGAAAGSEYRSGIFWGQISGGVSSRSSTSTLGGYDQINYGMTVGTDVALNKNATLGLAFGWMHGNASGSDDLSGTNVSANSFQFTGYGTERFGPAYVDGLLGLGYNRFTQNRQIDFIGTTASADYGGMAYMARIGGGWDFTLPVDLGGPSLQDGQNVVDATNSDEDKFILTLTPIAGFQAVRSDNNGYTETGAGVADLTVAEQIVNSYATTLGVKAATTLPTAWGDLKPEIKLAWVHDLNGNAVPTNGTLGGVDFTTTTPRVAQDGAQTTLTVTLQQGNTLSFRAEYDGDIRADYQSHTGLVKMLWDY